MKLSIIIPCFNASDTFESDVEYLLSECDANRIEVEVIVVDDGSLNGNVIRELCRKLHLVYIRHEKNGGKGNAVKTGMLAATGAIQIFTDADVPYKFNAVLLAIEKLQSGKTDVVIGDRTLPDSNFYGEMPFHRNLGSKLYSSFVRMFVLKNTKDTQCGFKCFTAEASNLLFTALSTTGFAFDVEILLRCQRNGLNVETIPVILRNRNVSSVTMLKALRMLTDTIKIRIRT